MAGGGQHQAGRCAPFAAPREPYCAAVLIHHLFNDGEPEASPVLACGDVGVEQFANLFAFWQATAVVVDLNADFIRLWLLHNNLHPPLWQICALRFSIPLINRVDGVLNQVG